MKWQNKAKIMKICDRLPKGDILYRAMQRRFGRLDSDPTSRIYAQMQMAKCIQEQGRQIEGKVFFEIGTGHKPIVPIGFFLSGAATVITIDAHARLDLGLTRSLLSWIAKNHEEIKTSYAAAICPDVLEERLGIIDRTWSEPTTFLKEANIQYIAPGDAARTFLKDKSIDYHFSVTTLEHIPLNILRKIFTEGYRILKEDGLAIHFIDLSDHFQHQDKSISKINFLQFPEKEYQRIAGNEFAYCNRLRQSNFISFFEELSFEVVWTETEIDEEAIWAVKNGFPLYDKFRSYEIEDICTIGLNIILRR